MKKIYLLYYGNSYVPKNKLLEAIQKYLFSISRAAVPADKIRATKKQIIDKIKALNKEHPRCTPIEPNFWEYYEQKKNNLSNWSQLL